MELDDDDDADDYYLRRYNELFDGAGFHFDGKCTRGVSTTLAALRPGCVRMTHTTFVDTDSADVFAATLTAFPMSIFEWTASPIPKCVLLALHRIPELHILTLHSCDIDNTGMSILMQTLSSLECPNTRLRALSIQNNGLDAVAVRMLTFKLCTMSLRVLDLSGNPLGVEGVRSVAYAPASQTMCLRELYLWQTEMGDSGLELLCDGLAASGTDLGIEILDVSSNGITSLVPLSRMAGRGSLVQLNLAQNALRRAAIESFVPSLIKSSTLKYVDISKMQELTGEDIMPLFVDHILSHPVLRGVNMNHTGVPLQLRRRLRAFLDDDYATLSRAVHVMSLSRAHRGLTVHVMRMVCGWVWGYSG